MKLLAAQHLSQAQFYDFYDFYDFFARAERTANVDLYDRLMARHLDSKSRSYRKCRVLGRRRISIFALDVPSRTFALMNGVCHCSSRGLRCAI
jgi:S-adenosylmethionine:diacylglycerol 3-amino-3-carboxypropyl transferase